MQTTRTMKNVVVVMMALATMLIVTGCQTILGGGIGIAGAALMDRPIKKAVKRLGEDQGVMRTDISTLDQNVNGLNQRVTTLEDGQTKQGKAIEKVTGKVSVIENEMLAEAAAKRAEKAAEDKRLADAKAKAKADAQRKLEIAEEVEKQLRQGKCPQRLGSTHKQQEFSEDEDNEDFVVGRTHRTARTYVPARRYEDPDYGKTVIRMRAGRAADIAASGDVIECLDANEAEITLKYK